MKTIVALYEDFATAERAVQALVGQGFARDQISLVANNATGEHDAAIARGTMVESQDVSAGEGAATGAAEGGVIGLLAGMGALAIPGIGPVLAVGPFIGALTGALVGALAGGLVAGLVDLGVTEGEAEVYAESVRRGGVLLTLHTEDHQGERAASILNQFGPLDIDQQGQHLRQQGWTRYDAGAQPLAADELRRERERVRAARAGMDTDHTGLSGVTPQQDDLHTDTRQTEQPGGVRIHTRQF